MKRILLLTDFSEASKKAIHFAQALFNDTATEFHLLNVYSVEPDTFYGTAFLLEESEREARANLQDILDEITTQPVAPYHRYHMLVAPGSPIGVVEAALEREPYDFVVVGATGSGFFPVLGSVATGLIRQIKANVLVVPGDAVIKPFREVVLAVDYNTLKTSCLQPLSELVSLKSARLTALSIVDNQTPMLTNKEFKRYSQQLVTVFDSVETEPYFILDDTVEHGIETYLATHSVDLLVTVPYRKTLMDVLWNRSLTRRLAYNPRVPLLALYDDPESVDQLQADTELIEQKNNV